MIAAVLLGAGVGLGLWVLALWAAPPAPALGRVLTRLQEPAATPVRVRAPDGWPDWSLRAARPAVRLLGSLGLPSDRISRDLRVVGRDRDTLLAEKVVYALVGLLTAPAAAVLLTLAGAPPPLIPVAAAIGLAALGFLLPDIRIRAAAARRRRDFRYALSAFLDLVVVSLSGGAGIDGALADSLSVGDGWAFTQLRNALESARLTRATPWSALRRLGDDLGIRELGELATSLALAGTEGARVRASLAARAQSLRTHLLTDADAQARAATERMGLPWGLLFLGFLIFIGYPAMTQILTSL